MELRHLRYFIAVAEEENVTRAAAKLHVAQPSLSRQIRDLEYELGVSLFDHAARTVRLTDAGRLFLMEAREVVSRFEDAIRTVRAFASGHEGEFHVGYAPSLTTKILPATLRNFQTACPKVRVKLHDLSTEEMLAGLRNNSLHAALLVKPSMAGLDGLLFEEIIRYRPCVAMALSHPLAERGNISSADLAGQALLAYSHADYPEYHTWLEKIFKGHPMPRITAEYDSSTSLIAAIESGCGIALVQEGFENLAGSRLVIRLLEDAEEKSFSFGIACRKADPSDLIQRFKSAVFPPRASEESNKDEL